MLVVAYLLAGILTLLILSRTIEDTADDETTFIGVVLMWPVIAGVLVVVSTEKALRKLWNWHRPTPPRCP